MKYNVVVLISFFILVFSFEGYAQLFSEPKRIDYNYIGGFYKANRDLQPLYKANIKGEFIIARNKEDLLEALKHSESGTKIFLPGDRTYNLTGSRNLLIPGGITLFSDRGQKGSLGALVYSDELSTDPLFKTNGNQIKISGIRFRGPDSTMTNPKLDEKKRQLEKQGKTAELSAARFKTYGLPNSSFILVDGHNIEIENSEISAWSYAGVVVKKSGYAYVHHCYIHHNQRAGLGYGVYVDEATALVKGNIFDFNRHAIAGSGRPGTGYTASYNIALPNSSLQGHIFDMHGGVDRKDNTNIAGDEVIVHNNIFYVTDQPAVKIRGISQRLSKIYKNTFLIVPDNNIVKSISNLKFRKVKKSKQNYIAQSGGKRGNLEASENRLRSVVK